VWVCAAGSLLRAGDRPLQPVTVCEVLEHLADYNGKVVAVVGRFSYRRTGRWLDQQKCAGGKPAPGGPERANSLWLDYDPALAPKPPAVLAVDSAQLVEKLGQVKAATALNHFPFGSSDYDTWAVAYGRVEASLAQPKGFGYGGTSAAQLVCHGDAVVVFLNDEATAPSSR
jgi:hypothetical protein